MTVCQRSLLRVALALPLAGLAVSCGQGQQAPTPRPSVITVGASGLTAHRAVLQSQVVWNGTTGGADFRIGGAPDLLISGRWPYLDLPGAGLGAVTSGPSSLNQPYSCEVTGLVPGYSYRFQAMATNPDGGESRGAVLGFTTPPAAESTWARVFFPTQAGGLVPLGDGFAVIGGGWGDRIWGVAYDGAGALRWQRSWVPGNEAGQAPRATAAGLQFVSRRRLTSQPGPSDWESLVTRLDGSGAVIWQRSFARWLTAGGPTADGGAVLMGGDATGALLLRLAANGTVAWTTANDSGADPLPPFELAGGRVAAVGRSVTLAGRYGVPVQVRAADGTLAWRRVYALSGTDSLAEVAEPAADGGLLVAGSHWSPGQVPLALRLAPDGSLRWALRLAGEAGTATGASATADGGWLLAGIGNLGTTASRYAWVAKVDDAGQILWARRYPAPFSVQARALELSGGRIALAGELEVGYGVRGVAVLLIGADGRAAGLGAEAALAVEALALAASEPAWTDRIPGFPGSGPGADPGQVINLTAVQLAPQD